MNIKTAHALISHLRSLNIAGYCLCAGARNSPLIALIEDNQNLLNKESGVFHFFEERCASFFALGRSQQFSRPVAIITTSGTAVSELISAAVEAYYTQTPLIFITADRPSAYRQSGAPQSINQIGIFSHYTAPTVEIENGILRVHETPPYESTLTVALQEWNQKTPLHINVCFDEPLLDDNIPILDSHLEIPLIPAKVQRSTPMPKELREATPRFQRPLLIVGGLSPSESQFVGKSLQNYQGPLLLEALSGLRGDPHLESFRFQSGESFIQDLLQKDSFDSVIRIGAIPTTRIWRDLESKYKIPVHTFSSKPWSGLARTSTLSSLANLPLWIIEQKGLNSFFESALQWLEGDRQIALKIHEICLNYPMAEPSLVRTLSDQIGSSPLYLGNSLPVRYWDLLSISKSPGPITANRGANGIDGQLSSFLGWAPEDQHSWALFGDLTTLYDLAAPWIVPQLANRRWSMAIMNNHGGQIFNNLFGREAFLNRHQLNFKCWSEMWNLSYRLIEQSNYKELMQISHSSNKVELPQIWELRPSDSQTQQWHKEVKSL